MTAFASLLGEVQVPRKAALKDIAEKEAMNEQARNIIGMGKGQNVTIPNTLYYYIKNVEQFFRFKFKGNEEQASLWGFNVVVKQSRGRRYVKFNIPYNRAEKLLALSKSILKKHNDDGLSTVFVPALFDLANFQARYDEVMLLRTEAKKKDGNRKAANELAYNLCGYGKGQSSQTPDTLYWYITQVRDLLLVTYVGNEEQLSVWGFKVVVR
jgi:hypothetical protein